MIDTNSIKNIPIKKIIFKNLSALMGTIVILCVFFGLDRSYFFVPEKHLVYCYGLCYLPGLIYVVFSFKIFREKVSAALIYTVCAIASWSVMMLILIVYACAIFGDCM